MKRRDEKDEEELQDVARRISEVARGTETGNGNWTSLSGGLHWYNRTLDGVNDFFFFF